MPRVHAPTLQSIPNAPALAATDPRWVLAARAASLLQGGRAAILGPEQRRRLVATAQHMGLRTFDAGLIIAIVQDAARCGWDPLGPHTEGSLGLIREASGADRAAGLMLASVLLAAALFCGLLAWVGAL